MHDSHDFVGSSLQTGLGVYYLLVMLMNVGFAYFLFQRKNIPGRDLGNRGPGFPGSRRGQHLPFSLGDFPSNHRRHQFIMNPVSYFVMSCAGLAIGLYFRKIITEPIVAWGMLQFSLLFGGWAMTHPDFQAIITKPDNVPIVLLIYSVGFTTWLGMRQAVINDERLARGEPPMEKTEEDKVLVWPDLVYTELICMVVSTFGLTIWAVYFKAPLEQPSSRSEIPNPSKAPWYFLGLQEMLVYFDPWMAGVVLPTFIVIGLIALPYIDFNQKGNGYYTFVQRRFAMTRS